MPRYDGTRHGDRVTVTVDGADLDPALDLKALSDEGFDWGYEGAAPAQLALALTLHHTGERVRALALYRKILRTVVATLPRDGWTLSDNDLRVALEEAIEVDMTLDELLDRVRGKG